tara:strand:- start:1947 stop:2381 length:435 start_codon:yes stop_codon:yes gene_type:complete
MKYLVGINVPKQTQKLFCIQDNKNKPRTVVFKFKNDAIQYAKFVIASKCKFNKWPNLNASDLVNETFEDATFKCHIPSYVSKFIEVVEIEENVMNDVFARSGMDIYLSESFQFDQELSVRMSIGERNYTYIDTDKFKHVLEERI